MSSVISKVNVAEVWPFGILNFVAKSIFLKLPLLFFDWTKTSSPEEYKISAGLSIFAIAFRPSTVPGSESLSTIKDNSPWAVIGLAPAVSDTPPVNKYIWLLSLPA